MTLSRQTYLVSLPCLKLRKNLVLIFFFRSAPMRFTEASQRGVSARAIPCCPAVPIRLVRQEETGLPIRIMSPTIFLLLSLAPATIMVRSSTLRNLSHSLLPTLLRIETYLSTVMGKMSVTGFMCQITVLPFILSLKTENWEKSTMWEVVTNFRTSILRIRYWNSWENPPILSNLWKIGRDTI